VTAAQYARTNFPIVVDSVRSRPIAAVVYGVPVGAGGLGQHSASLMHALAGGYEIHAFGPGRERVWPLPADIPPVVWHQAPPMVSKWRARYSWLRWSTGKLQFLNDNIIGRWAERQMRLLKPDLCYVFTQVGLETLRWARLTSVPTVLESPNGHIRNFRKVCETESLRWSSHSFRGHPSPTMVDRVEQEYALADSLRVSSQWSRASLAHHGIAAPRVWVFQQPVNLERFHPAAAPPPEGPLRVCFVGSLDFRKGFVYLLGAIKLIGSEHIQLAIVGATGSRPCRQLFERERKGVNLECAPGDPIPVYRRSEIMVLPTLEDGSPFAVAEAMASGLPVIVTDACGSAEWVRHGDTGWVIPAGDTEALAHVLEEALRRRSKLRAMGEAGRRDTEQRAGLHCLEPLRRWLAEHLSTRSGP
jgi:glycosyltransferase involved in cell wall biosynthesis